VAGGIDISSEAARTRVEGCFEQHHGAVYRYALRRTRDSAAAEEVVAEVFAVVWRRHAELPDDPLPWLYGIARNTLANRRRSARRQRRLAQRLITTERTVNGRAEGSETVVDSDAALWALGRLKETDRELLMLIAWEGLSPSDAAQVLGCSEASLRTRLSRARARLEQIMSRAGLAHGTTGSDHADREEHPDE
jgi:RNA polymerase sigma-70 factor (ECF subfamily)